MFFIRPRKSFDVGVFDTELHFCFHVFFDDDNGSFEQIGTVLGSIQWEFLGGC